MLAVNLVIRQPVNLVIRQPVNLVIRHIKKTSLVQKLNTSKAWQRLIARTPTLSGFSREASTSWLPYALECCCKIPSDTNEYKCMAQRTGTAYQLTVRTICRIQDAGLFLSTLLYFTNRTAEFSNVAFRISFTQQIARAVGVFKVFGFPARVLAPPSSAAEALSTAG